MQEDRPPVAILDYCRAHGLGSVRRVEPLGGGCIHNALRLETDGGDLFSRVNPNAPPAIFTREAEGLAALQAAGALRVPKVLAVGDHFILQDYIAPTARAKTFWQHFGESLAVLHQHTSDRFGFPHDNFLGRAPQHNRWDRDGWRFFGEQRLMMQGEMAHRNGWLTAAETRAIEKIAARLPHLVPGQPASLLHGDLWSGNVHTDSTGMAVLIDPAAHYGWAEADLAMLTLFGSPPELFFQAYQSVRRLEPNYRARFDLYNLYHLLNHLNLFGEGYYASAMTVVRQYE